MTKSASPYTVFCQEKGSGGTIWISAVWASSLDEAMNLGRAQCAADWDHLENDIHVLGVAEGNVRLAFWEDQIC